MKRAVLALGLLGLVGCGLSTASVKINERGAPGAQQGIVNQLVCKGQTDRVETYFVASQTPDKDRIVLVAEAEKFKDEGKCSKASSLGDTVIISPNGGR